MSVETRTRKSRHPATFDPRLADLRLLLSLSESLLTSRPKDDPGIQAVRSLSAGESLSAEGVRAAITTAHAVRDALLPPATPAYWRIAGLDPSDAVAQAERYRMLRDDWMPAQIASLHQR